ncbi:hypothetical protein Dimus_004203, partial [Dionaea muscipula]
MEAATPKREHRLRGEAPLCGSCTSLVMRINRWCSVRCGNKSVVAKPVLNAAEEWRLEAHPCHSVKAEGVRRRGNPSASRCRWFFINAGGRHERWWTAMSVGDGDGRGADSNPRS